MLQRTPTESEIESEDAIATTSEPTITTRYLIVQQETYDQFIISNTSSNSMFTTPTASPTHMEYNNTIPSVTPPALPPLHVEDVDRSTSPYGPLTKAGGNSLLHPMMMAKTNGVSHSASSSSGISLRSSSSSSCSNTNGNNDAGRGVPQNASSSSTSIGVNLRVTGQCSQGGRKYMEDYFSVAYQEAKSDMTTNGVATSGAGVDGGGVSKELEYAFFGIYDGHGGAEAALFAKENLMIEIVSQKAFWSDSDEDVMRAIREGYIATHFAMWREHERWPRTANGHLSTAGTTATVAFLRREKIYIGHVGDSGVVLGYQNENENFWRAKQLTTDHKPESPLERKRIQRSGGNVTVKSGVPRVVWNRPRDPSHRGPIRQSTPVDDIPFLAVARSLGDLWSYSSEYNEFVVSPDPDVKVVKINPKTFRCLIFGTDGLWNVVSAQEAVDSVYEKERINTALRLSAASGNVSSATCMQSANPSKTLVEKAIKTWSSKKMRADNTSVVTVILYPNKVTNLSDKALPKSNCMGTSLGNSLKVVTPPELPPLPQHFMFGNDILIDEYVPTMPYSQVVKKYLPPLEYRNFNYYEEEEDEELIVESSMRLDYTDEDDDDDEDDEDDDDVDGVETGLGANSMLGGGLPGVDHYGTHLIASAPDRSHCAWDAFDRGSGSGSGSKSAWIKSALEVCMPQTNEWVELEIDRDSDAISAEISTTSTTLTTTTCAPRPPSVVESMAMDINYCRNVNEDAAGVDELYGEEVYVDPIESNELVELDVVEPHSFVRFMHSDNAMDTDQSTTGYTFAESYNLLLNGQEARNSSTSRNTAISSTSSSSTTSGGGDSGASGSSNSSSSGMSSPTTYQSIDSTSMQEILQEQQRYQEQEGYSLTKLETRREQQRSATSSTFDDERACAGQSVSEWNQHYVTTTIEQQTQHGSNEHVNESRVVSRYNQRQEQLLELNSLLQQEREEERLVALEQRAMQQRMLNHCADDSVEDDTITSVNNADADAKTSTDTNSDCSNSRIYDPLEDDRDYATVDFAVTEEASNDYVVESRRETTTAAMEMTDDNFDDDNDANDNERTLQINEVSSTDVPDVADRTIETHVQKTVDEIRQEDNTAVTFIFEQIKKLKDIEYTPVSKTVKAAVQRAVAIAAGCTDTSKMAAASSSSSPSNGSATLPTSSTATGTKTRRMRYRNIPNENMMQTRRKGTCAKFKRKTHSFINNAAAAIIAYNTAPSSSSRTNATTSSVIAGPMTTNGSIASTNNSTKTVERNSGIGNATATVRSPYATRNEVRISKRQLRSTVCNLDITQRTLRTRNHALPKDMKNGNGNAQRSAATQQQTTNSYQKRTTTTTLGCGAVTHRSSAMTNTSSSLKHAKEQHQNQNLRQALLVKRAASEQTSRAAPQAKRAAPSIGFTPPVTYLNLRSRRRIMDEPTITTQPQHQHQKNCTPAAMNAVAAAAAVAVNGKRFEYRRSLRRSNVVGGGSSVSGIGSVGNNHGNGNISSNVSGGSFSKSTRLQSALGAIASRPPPSPKKLTITSIGGSGGGGSVVSCGGTSSNTGSNNARQALFAAAAAAAAAGKDSKTTEVLVDFSKRWSLRSKRATLPLPAHSTTTTTMALNTAGSAGGGGSVGGAAAVAATTAAALAARTSLENAINCYTNSTIASRTRLNRKR